MNSREHNTPKLKRKKYLPLLHQYAASFNGTDENLTRALPVNLLTGNQNDFVSAGTIPAGFSASGATWNQTGISGSTSTNAVKLTGTNAYAMYTGLTVGKKYKLRVRWYGDSALRIGSSSEGSDYGTVAPTTQWNRIIRTFVAVSTSISFSMASGTGYIDFINFTEDWKLDLNESYELIKHSDNRDFEGTDIAYTGTGNHSAVRSTADKYAGSGSLKISATGAGTSGSNYVSLPYTSMETLVSGKKYTKEVYAKLDPTSLTYGSNILTGDNTNFSGSVGNWITEGASGTVSVESGSLKLVSTRSAPYISIASGITAITSSVVKITAKVKSTTYTGKMLCYFGSGVSEYFSTNDTNITSDWQTLTWYLLSRSTAETFYIQTNTTTAGEQTFYFDDITIQKVPYVSLASQIGTKSVSTNLLLKNYQKFVLNFEATSGEVNQDLKLYLSGAGSVFVDGISLTQRYDMALAVVQFQDKASTGVVTDHTLGVPTSPTVKLSNYNGLQYISVSEKTSVAHANNGESYGATSEVLNQWVYYLAVVNTSVSTGNILLYRNNMPLISKNNNTQGKIIYESAFKMAVPTNGGCIGKIGKTQIIRFDNISQSNFSPQTYKPGYPVSGGGAEIVFWFDPKNGSSVANMLQDYSGNENNLSAVNMDLTNRVIVRK